MLKSDAMQVIPSLNLLTMNQSQTNNPIDIVTDIAIIIDTKRTM